MSTPESLSRKENLYTTSEMHGVSTGHPRRRKMNSFACTGLPNTASGIWDSTTKNPRIPRATMNFPMGISKKCTAAACSPQKAARVSINIMISRTRQRTCMECWTPGRLHRLRSAHGPLHLARRRARHGIRRDNPIAVSAVHDPKDQTEQHAHKQTGHQREIERDIFPLNHDVAGQPPQPDPAQIGPKQTGHQKGQTEHDQKTCHCCQSLPGSCVNSAGADRTIEAAS